MGRITVHSGSQPGIEPLIGKGIEHVSALDSWPLTLAPQPYLFTKKPEI
jgi:hypothetical protein